MASRRSEIRAERKALKEKEALQNASSGLKHKFTVVDALMYAFIAILSLSVCERNCVFSEWCRCCAGK